MMRNKPWRELTPCQRVAVIAVAILQLTVNALIQRDLSRRSDADLRGGKGLWRALAFVQPVGPIAYFLIGRRRTAAA